MNVSRLLNRRGVFFFTLVIYAEKPALIALASRPQSFFLTQLVG